MDPITELPLDSVRLDGGTQPREGTDEDTVCRYADAYEAGEPLPPVVVFHDGKDYWLADGFHRYLARLRLHERDDRDFGTVPCVVKRGTKRDAVLYACGANAEHGLPRSRADMRRAVLTLLQDPEWSGWSVNAIAQRCRVSWAFAKAVADSLGQESPPERTYERAGEVRTMQTKNIGPTSRAGSGEAPEGDSSGEPATAFSAALPTPPPEEAPPPATPPPAREVAVDAIGLPLAGDALAAFGVLELAEEAEALYRKLAGLVDRIAHLPGGERYRQRLTLKRTKDRDHFHCPDLDNSLREFQWAKPYASVCPACHHKHPGQSDQQCAVCKGLPYVVKDSYDRTPEEFRQAVEALARGEEYHAA